MNGDLIGHPLALSARSVELPLTICVLAYGAHANLAERFLSSLYRTADSQLFHLRAGLNEVESETHRLFHRYAEEFGNIQLFVEPRNIFKCPLMRRMFHTHPISSAWTIWCDDDSYFTRSDWLQRLALRVEGNPDVAMWGMQHALWRRDSFILEWIKAANWYRGMPFRSGTDLQGQSAWEFRFVTGGFWAIRSSVLRQFDWPDRRLVQANDDFLLGEALRQNGLTMGTFHSGVVVNSAPRRNAAALQVMELPC